MKLSIDDIPQEWADLLRKKALEEGYKSVGDYMRFVIAQLIGVEGEFQPKAWGGPRQAVQDERLDMSEEAISAEIRKAAETKKLAKGKE